MNNLLICHWMRRALMLGFCLHVVGLGSARAQSAVFSDPSGSIAALNLEEGATPVREVPGWRSPAKVVVSGFTPEHVMRLREVAPGAEIVHAQGRAELLAAAVDADVMIAGCNAEVLSVAERLQWFQHAAAGVENCVTIPAIRERRVLLTNMQGVQSSTIAEHAMAMLLALTRRLDTLYDEQLQGRWNAGAVGTMPGSNRRMEVLSGKTMLVVGLGGIGTEVARRAHAFGMRVIATRNTGRTGPDFVSYVGLSGELLALAAEADVVVMAAPLTPATTGLFNAEFFEAVKPGAFFVNVARGRTVVTDDLIEALNSGRIAGAGLDVTDPEPLPPGHPLWTTPNVIITPHVAARSDFLADLHWALAYENLRRYVAGEKILSIVDPERGY